MNVESCEQTCELLPWWVNGSLEPDERRQVEDHLATCAACRAELAATRAAFELYGRHLPVSAVVAWAERPGEELYAVDRGGTLSGALVAAHLEGCAACREEVEMARAGRRALAAGEGAPAPPLAFRRRAADASPARHWRRWALAASLVLFAVAAGGWFLTARQVGDRAGRVAELERRLAEARSRTGSSPGEIARLETSLREALVQADAVRRRLEAAEGSLERTRGQVAELERRGVPASVANVPIATLYPADGEVVRGGEGPQAVPEVPGAAGWVHLSPFLAPDRLAGGPFSWRIVGADGHPVLAGEGLAAARDALGTPYLSLLVETAALPAGPLTLELRAGGRTVAAYPFRVAR